VAQTRERRRGPGEHTWSLDLQPGVTRTYRVVLKGSLPVEEAMAGVPMPDVSAPGFPGATHWVAVAGLDLTAEEAVGLTPVADPAALAAWRGEAERLRRTNGKAWRVASEEWRLRLLPRPRLATTTPIRVFLTDRSAAVVDGRRWLHQATCWLRHEANTDLNVTLPAPAEVMSVSIDGVGVTPLQPERTRLWLPLPGHAGIRCVRLSWFCADESFDRPNLECPRLEGAVEGPVLWTVVVSPGWAPEAGSEPDLDGGLPRRAALELTRATAQFRIAARLADTSHDGAAAAQLAGALRRVSLHCRQAEHVLGLSGESGSETGPEGQSLPRWLQELKEQGRDLARRTGVKEAREETEPDATPTEGGMPYYARGGADNQAAPQLALVSTRDRENGTAVIATAQWLALLGFVAGLSFFPTALARIRLLWPEQLGLLGGLGWWLVGPTVLAVFLVVLAVCGRVLVLAQGFAHWRQSRAILPARSAGSSPGSAG
jgi:hypothetical protein